MWFMPLKGAGGRLRACLERGRLHAYISLSARYLRFYGLILWLMMGIFWPVNSSAQSLTDLVVPVDRDRVDLSQALIFEPNAPPQFKVSTPAGPEGIVRRIEIVSESATITNWAAFALTNNSDSAIERVITSLPTGSINPYLPNSHGRHGNIIAITASQGIAADRDSGFGDDVFRIRLDPQSTTSFVAELRYSDLPNLQIWTKDAYADRQNNLFRFNGMLLGVNALLVIFLSIVCLVKRNFATLFASLFCALILILMLSSTATVQPGALIDIQDDVYFQVLSVGIIYGLCGFMFYFIEPRNFIGSTRPVLLIITVCFVILEGLTLLNGEAAGLVNSYILVTVVAISTLVIVALAAMGHSPAILLLPLLSAIIFWLISAYLIVQGQITSDMADQALDGGLTLIMFLMVGTATHFGASVATIPVTQVRNLKTQAMALQGEGNLIWEWDIKKDFVTISGDEASGEILLDAIENARLQDWLDFLHPQDYKRFQAVTDAIIDDRHGRIDDYYRLRGSDGYYRTFRLRARPQLGHNREVRRCIGTLEDVTGQTSTQERLLNDFMYDSLTGFANAIIFTDRVNIALTRARAEFAGPPTLLNVNIDQFRYINNRYGYSAGDSVLLTVARRISRFLRPQDSAGRLLADSFSILLLSERDPTQIAAIAEQIRQTINQPMNYGDQELTVSSSVGVAIYEADIVGADRLHANAEVAVQHAKGLGGNRVEIYRPTLKQVKRRRENLREEFLQALSAQSIEVVYQPIFQPDDRHIVGFSAIPRWTKARRRLISADHLQQMAKEGGALSQLDLLTVSQAARKLSEWHGESQAGPPLFAVVKIGQTVQFDDKFLSGIRAALEEFSLPKNALLFEFQPVRGVFDSERLEGLLAQLRQLGIGSVAAKFGTEPCLLKHLPLQKFNLIHLARELVGADKNGLRPSILRSLIALAHDLDSKILVDEALRESDMLELQQMGCDLIKEYGSVKYYTASETKRLLKRQIRSAT